MFHPSVGNKHTPVQDDQGELEKAERGSPGELLDKECLQKMWHVSKCHRIPSDSLPSKPTQSVLSSIDRYSIRRRQEQ